MEANSEYQSQFSSEGLKDMSRQREKPSDSLSSGKECEFVLFFFFYRQGCFLSELLCFVSESTCYQGRWPQLAFSLTGFK